MRRRGPSCKLSRERCEEQETEIRDQRTVNRYERKNEAEHKPRRMRRSRWPRWRCLLAFLARLQEGSRAGSRGHGAGRASRAGADLRADHRRRHPCALAQAAIAPKITRAGEEVLCGARARVKAGELLATLENSDLTAAAMDNKGSLRSRAGSLCHGHQGAGSRRYAQGRVRFGRRPRPISISTRAS